MDMLKFKAVERNLNGNGSVATSSGIAQTWDNKCTNTREPWRLGTKDKLELGGSLSVSMVHLAMFSFRRERTKQTDQNQEQRWLMLRRNGAKKASRWPCNSSEEN